ncbi:hypothetical protein [Brevibacterium sp.]|uniref:hypothetical protein n=1 Tax=Brevibacterium sp. TaxID=1701 RepID=UPI0025C44FCB|nr:hypothetical protein [Brevibacterium sp.]
MAGTGSGTGGGAPEALPPRPASLGIAVGVVALEAVALVVATVAFVVVGAGAGATSVLALAGMFAVLALGLVAVALSLWRLHRWGRPAGIAWQVLLVLVGLSMFSTEPLNAVGVIAPAAVFLVAILMPASLRAYELGAEYHAAHPSAPAPPPKRW